MKEDGDTGDELASWEEEAEEQEPQPDLLYDPLTEPWNDPASTSVVEHRLSERGAPGSLGPEAAPGHPAGTYPHAEELSELRRRLREETVVIPKRRQSWWASVGGATETLLVAVLAGGALLTPGLLLDVFGVSDGSVISYGAAAAVAAGVLLVVAAIVTALTGRMTTDAPVSLSTSPLSEETVAIPKREETIVVPKPRRMWSVTAREVAETLLLAVLIFLAVRASMQNFRVEGASMEPSLDNGEYLIVNRLAYAEIDLSVFDWLPFFDSGENPVHHLWDSPSRGDVVVFRSPTNVRRDFIKRIIGEPGDTVEIEKETGAVKVNGEFIDEPYVRGRTSCQRTCGPWVVPERAYFVMGDNRQNSSDSRQGWFAPEENIIGKALITYWHEGGPELDLAPNHKVSFSTGAAAEE